MCSTLGMGLTGINSAGIASTDRDLFGFRGAYLPPAFDGETLYSWCARYHRLNGAIGARQTSRMLFGNSTAGLRHDFPTHLDHFHSVTAGLLGSVEELIRRRTLYGFHAPFLSSQIANDVILSMRSGSTPGPRTLLGLAASQLGVTAPLKACPDCMVEDQGRNQTTWWHLEHQLPSVRVCLRHGTPLSVARNDLHIRTLKDWWLPTDCNNQHWSPTPQLNRTQQQTLVRIAEWTGSLVHHDSARFDQVVLRYAYLLQAQQRGWLALDGSVRLQSLRDAFAETNNGLERLPGLSFLGGVSGINGGFLGMLLRRFPSARHPVKHIYLMAFLFDKPSEFLEHYGQVKEMEKYGGITLLDELLRDQIAQLRRMIVEEDRSVNAAASELGVAPTQAIRHLDNEGIPYKKRPRVLSPNVERRLQILLKAGKERQEISSELGIRTSFIKDYLARHPPLKSAWTHAWSESRKKKYRKHFLEVLRDNPGVPMKQIKRISGNGFQWLNRNDKKWLADSLPTVR